MDKFERTQRKKIEEFFDENNLNQPIGYDSEELKRCIADVVEIIKLKQDAVQSKFNKPKDQVQALKQELKSKIGQRAELESRLLALRQENGRLSAAIEDRASISNQAQAMLEKILHEIDRVVTPGKM
uniref:Uncharacterized protein n=1 Tax=Fibrocapsa japonica TaxID=94617 RepID=A0A7S2XWZ0_9STRA|mmetsp:Transcript_17671/g.25803  ORF Transcript_17671/g.25803 Transcript_17671/m.25803 type:complete len:127 (+) Transcript_17671:12-392(+)